MRPSSQPTVLVLASMAVLGLRCEPSCPEGMARIAGGDFAVGLEEPSEAWHEPRREVELGPFCIDRYEFPNRAGELPAHSDSWHAADRQCRAVGKRLCSSDEWERACRGPHGHRYAYGPVRRAEACNTPWETAGQQHGLDPLAPSGSHPDCVSAEGVYDLNGNLSEWVADEWTGHRQPFDYDLGLDEPMRIVRGGTMWSATSYGQDCLSRHGHPPTGRYHDDGFRCCLDAR